MSLPIYQQGQTPQDYLNTVIQARPDREQQYQGALSQMKDAYAARSVEGDDAAQWGALARGFAKPAQNFWQSLANAGADKADVVAGIDARNLDLNRQSAMAEYKTAADLLKQDDMLTRAMAARAMGGNSGKGGRNLIKQGEIWLEKQMDGSWKPIAAGESALVDKDYQFAINQAAKILNTDDPDVLREYAIQYVEQKKSLRAGNPVMAAQGQAPNPPLTPVQVPQAQQAAQTPEVSVAPTVDRTKVLPQLLRDYERALTGGDTVRAKELQDGINAIRSAPTYGEAPIQTPPARLKTAESEGEMEARGKERGKTMEQTFQNLQATGVAANDLNGQLNIMKGMFAKYGDDIPSGELAPVIANIKSSLSTFGVDFKGLGATDVVQGIGTMGALKSRTADGQNLLPGAMSNYEDQLLQRVFPTIGKSKEGRLLQIEILQAQLRMRAEMAAAARDYYQQHGRLDNGWHSAAEVIAKKNPFLDPRRIAAMEAYAARLAKGTK